MGEWRYSSSILGLDTSCRYVVSFTTRPLYLPEKVPPGTHWIGGWVGPREGLDAVEPACSLSQYRLSYPEGIKIKYKLLTKYIIKQTQ
jgi:hypothetical protein